MTTLYTTDHEWIEMDTDGVGTVGITDYAQQQLGDVVFVELPEVGSTVALGGETGVVESVKAASEIYSPCTGEITEANEALADDPALLNRDPEGDGWMYKIQMTDTSETDDLMDEDAYKAFVAELE